MESLPKPKTQASRVTEALNEAYELMGGVPTLAIWAQSEPTEFYKLWAKTGQKMEVAHTGEVIIRPALPPTSLDEQPAIEGESVELPTI